MKTALVIVFSNLQHDARVKRQIGFLKKRFKVTVVAFEGYSDPEIEIIAVKQSKPNFIKKAIIATLLFTRIYKIAHSLLYDYNQTIDKIKRERTFDLIISNDIETLSIAFEVKGSSSAKIFFDAHEYAPRHFEDRFFWRTFFQPLYKYLCAKYIPQVDAMMTVGQGLADEYEKHFKVKPVIITNAPHAVNIESSLVIPNKIRLVHHGIANVSRRLELMLEMMKYLDDRFTLDLMLMTSDYASQKTRNYIEQFKEKAKQDPRIKILPAVPSSEVIKTIQPYDMGVFLIPPVNFNYANTLPNKFFDFIQARLAIAIGPTPEMAKIVNDYTNGVVSSDFTAKNLAEKLSSISTEQLKLYKENSSQAAAVLNAEHNEKIFNQAIDKIFQGL